MVLLAVLASAIPQSRHIEPAQAEPVCSANSASCNSLAQLAVMARKIHPVKLLDDGIPADKDDLVASTRSLLESAEADMDEADVAAEAVKKLPAQLAQEAEKVTDETDGQAERMARSLEAAAIGASAAVPGLSAIAATLKAAAPQTLHAIEQSATKEVKLLQEAASNAVKTISAGFQALEHGQVRETEEQTLEVKEAKREKSKVKVQEPEALEANEEALQTEMEEERDKSKVKIQGGSSLMQTAMTTNWRHGTRQLSLSQTALSVGMFFSGLVCSALVVKQVRADKAPQPQRHRMRFEHSALLERVEFESPCSRETRPVQMQVQK